jgi:peptide/nickel transport system substrate-binding protein
VNTGHKTTRRRFVAGTAAGAAAAGIASQSALAHDVRHQAPAVFAQSASIPTPRDQTLVIEQSPVTNFDSFNPFVPNGEAYQYGVTQACRESLFYENFETGETINWLGTGWSYNDDFTELTISLNTDAHWSDGEPFTSADVEYVLNLLLENPAFFGAGEVIEYVTSVAAPDPETVTMTLNQANPRFHYNFLVGIVNAPIKIVPKHIWEPEDANTFANNPPIYTGPYLLDRTVADQFMYIWKKNPDYWNSANLDPKPEYVIYRQELPVDASIQEFTRGDLDISRMDFLNQQVVADSYDDAQLYNFFDPCPRGIHLNQDSPSGIFQSAEGRWAISYLLNREVIGSTIWQPPTDPAQYPWAAWGANDEWQAPDIQEEYDLVFDPDKAAELLDGIGATLEGDTRQMNGEPLELEIITPTAVGQPEFQIAELLASEAAKIGLKMTVSSLPGPTFDDAWNLGQFDVSSHWLCGVALDPAQLYTQYLTRKYEPIGDRATQGNQTRTQIPELNDIALELESLDPEDPENKPKFDQGLEAFMSNLPSMPSIQTIYPMIFNTAYWTNWPSEDDRYNIAANWWAQFLFVIGNLEPVEQ